MKGAENNMLENINMFIQATKILHKPSGAPQFPDMVRCRIPSCKHSNTSPLHITPSFHNNLWLFPPLVHSCPLLTDSCAILIYMR